MRNTAEELDLAGHRFAEAIRLLQHLDLHCRDASNHRFAHHVRRQGVFENHEFASVTLRRHAPPQDDLVFERIEMRRRIMNRLAGPQYTHAGLELTGLVLDLHNHW